MLPDDLEARREGMDAATKRLNAGEATPEVEASMIERLWGITSRMPREQRWNRAIGLAAICDPGAPMISAEQSVALMARYMLLESLIERGVLDDYMNDESLRPKVFATVASMPCDKGDLSEALALMHLRDASGAEAAKIREMFSKTGADPENPEIDRKFREWLQRPAA